LVSSLSFQLTSGDKLKKRRARHFGESTGLYEKEKELNLKV
jgi:hypothetical protein